MYVSTLNRKPYILHPKTRHLTPHANCEQEQCVSFMRHKNFMVSPGKAKEFGISVFRCVQGAGEFVMTMPAAYHCGFNSGFNIAEVAL